MTQLLLLLLLLLALKPSKSCDEFFSSFFGTVP
jgi:hypothetical protein